MPKRSFVYAGSFWCRYRLLGERIEQSAPNRSEHPLPRSEEFASTMSADSRVNSVNIWQKPLCAEYTAFGIPEELEEAMFDDAFEHIERTPHDHIVTFDPYAFHAIRTRRPTENVVYYTECMPDAQRFD